MIRRRSALLDEHPLLVLPSLACAIGLEPAIFVQQIHYWILNNRMSGKPNIADGREWVYNTQEEWKIQFPFWSRAALQRVIVKAAEHGVVITMRPEGTNRRTWYTINYELIDEIEAGFQGVQLSQCSESNNGKSGVGTRNSDCTGFVPLFEIEQCSVQNRTMNNKESETTTENILVDSRPASANQPTEPQAAPAKKPRKPKEPKPETELFNRVKVAWFELANEREAQGKRSPHRMLTPADFKQFKVGIQALEQLAHMFEWTTDQTVAYTIEAAVHQLDTKWWRDRPMTPYRLKQTVDSLQGWWQTVKKPALAEKRAPAPPQSTPAAAIPAIAHIQQVTSENLKRQRDHQQRLDELAEKGQAPLGYSPSRKNPFQRE